MVRIRTFLCGLTACLVFFFAFLYAIGFVMFWVAPVMTAGHLLFAAVTTAYTFIGIAQEKHDLVEVFDDEYRLCRKYVSKLVPFWHEPD